MEIKDLVSKIDYETKIVPNFLPNSIRLYLSFIQVTPN